MMLPMAVARGSSPCQKSMLCLSQAVRLLPWRSSSRPVKDDHPRPKDLGRLKDLLEAVLAGRLADGDVRCAGIQVHEGGMDGVVKPGLLAAGGPTRSVVPR